MKVSCTWLKGTTGTCVAGVRVGRCVSMMPVRYRNRLDRQRTRGDQAERMARATVKEAQGCAAAKRVSGLSLPLFPLKLSLSQGKQGTRSGKCVES